MASSLINSTQLDANTLLAILLERVGGGIIIPEDAAIAMIDNNADVRIEQMMNGDLMFTLLGKAHG